MTVQRITRNRYLTPEEAERYRKVREQVAEELPDLGMRHDERRPSGPVEPSPGLRPNGRCPGNSPLPTRGLKGRENGRNR